MKTYETIIGEKYYIQELPEEHQKILKTAEKKYQKSPDWDDFAIYHSKLTKPVFDKLPRRKITKTALWNICQDMELRLGIEQGKTLMPDYRDILEYHIRKKYESVADFCRETGIAQSYLSHIFSKRKNASIEKLEEIVDKLGLQITLKEKSIEQST